MSSLELIDITKKFKNNVILENLNIKFNSGKIYGVMGPNGSGKSVLLKIISGIMLPNSGEIRFNDKIVTSSDIPLINVGVSIDKPQFIEELSGLDNLLFLSDFRKIVKKDEIIEWLKHFELFDNKDKLVKTYSLGMKQKLSIIQAIMENPEIVLLDEVSNSLDRSSKELLFKTIKDVKDKDRIIIYINHNTEEMKLLCDEIYEIDKGRLVKCEI